MTNVNKARGALRTWAIALIVAVAASLLGAGCTATGKNAIPPGTDRVTSGEGPIDYRAQHDGDIWIYDADSKKMVYTGPVRDGDRVRVNTGANQILVGGRTVSERPLNGDHKYEIYFRRPN
jgi:hypothetical protein